MIEIKTVEEVFLVKAPYEMRDKMKLIPANRWNTLMKAWQFPANPVSAWNIFLLAQDAVKSLLDDGWTHDKGFKEYLDQFKLLKKIRSGKCRDMAIHKDWQLTTKPWDHQITGMSFISQVKRGLLDMEMGTGKSLTGIGACNLLMAKAILILCPKSVINVWPNQLNIHSAREYEILVLNQPSVGRKVEYLNKKSVRLQMQKDPYVIICNYDSAWRDGLKEVLSGWPFDVVILDESQRIKSPKANASKFVFKNLQHVPNIYALSGSCMPNSPSDIFGQYRALNTAVYGVHYYQFRNRFVKMGGYGDHQEIGFKNEKEFRDRFECISFTAKKEDCLDLPDEVEEDLVFELKPKAKKIHDKMERDFLVELEHELGKKGTIVASNAMVNLLRLQQITSGFAVTEEGETEFIDSSKKDILKDLLEDVKMPVIVFCRFRHDLEMIRDVAESLKFRCGELSGKKNDLDENAKLPQDIDVLAVQIQSGGVGVDLSRSSTAIYYSLGYSLGDYQQSRARLHRPGQLNKVTAIHLIAKGTVDGKVLRALKKKKKVIDELIRDIRE